MNYKFLKETYIFYIFITITLFVLLYTHPFLRYPYDMFHHLIVMDNLYMQLTHPIEKFTGIWANDFYIMLPTGEVEPLTLPRPRYLWHYIWAEIFVWFDIDSTQIFLRAKIIHLVQTVISLSSIYYFSNVILRNIFKEIPTLQLCWLSLWSVFIWLTIYATFSQLYHQVWMLWYSVNYQITLPLFWYILGLTLVLLLEKTSWKIKLFFIFQIILLTRFMLQVHSMEFLYYLMHMVVFGLVFIDKVYLLLKRYFYLFIPLIIAIIYMSKHYQPEKSQIFKYLSWDKLPELYNKIMESGLWLVNGQNRAYASINELMYFILYFAMVFVGYLLWKNYKKKTLNIEGRVLLYVMLTSLFVLIPLYQFSGGLLSVISRMNVVNRLYYSASLFVLIPLFSYAMFRKYKPQYMHLFIALSLVLVVLFSKYSEVLHHNYYKNLSSIKQSFNKRKIGFNLSDTQIDVIKQELDTYEKNNHSSKPIQYYARADIAFILKYIYKKNVHWEGKFGGIDYKKNYNMNKNNQSFQHILFEIPDEFPPFIPYK